VVQPRSLSFPGYDEFSLSNGAVKEGVQDNRRDNWYRGEYLMSDGDESETPIAGAGGTGTRPLKSVALTLDDGGGGKALLEGIPRQDAPQEILAELEYNDPNGETLTSSARIPLWPAALVVGLKPDAWALTKDKVKFQAVALDLSGNPVTGAHLSVDLFERKTFCSAGSTRTKAGPRSNACSRCARVRPTPRVCCSASSPHRCRVRYWSKSVRRMLQATSP
jgi:hypothetical protein